jgi:hypothetical protein
LLLASSGVAEGDFTQPSLGHIVIGHLQCSICVEEQFDYGSMAVRSNPLNVVGAMMTTASESSEESLHWAQCQNCNSVGPFASYCTQCEDQGYVYVEPIRSQDEEGPDPYELDLNKSKEYWNFFFSNLGYLPAEKIVQIKAAFLE